MQSLSIDPAVPFAIGPQAFTIVIVGAGGTGSFVVQSVARMLAQFHATGGPSVRVYVIDGDVVEPKNVGRQLFSPGEVGRNKAQTLVARFNAALGVQMEAIPAMATAGLLDRLEAVRGKNSQIYNILVGAVDSAEGRQAINTALATWRYQMWIDSGNHESGGQVALGTEGTKSRLAGSFLLGGVCTALPAPALLYPRLIKPIKTAPRQDCAAAMEDNRQSLMVNQAMAAIVGQYLYQITTQRRIETYETVIDLKTLSMKSTLITAANIAAACKMDISQLTERKAA